MKGIILAGGSGTRLYPSTKVISKQLLPIYDKPMIFYPLSTLMLTGIKDILIISTPEDIGRFELLLENGAHLGIKISYVIQPSPDGLAQAFILGEKFIGSDSVSLILGDNIFFGHGFSSLLKKSVEIVKNTKNAIIFGYNVKDPERYGVVGYDIDGNVESIEEKPKNPKSKDAIVGLYFYPNDVIEIAKGIKPSKRGELEISSINEEFMRRNQLSVEIMGRGYAWLDTGTHESMMNASNFIKIVEERQGFKIGCIEEIAYLNNLISDQQVLQLAETYKNEYGEYLRNLIKNK
ncbi:glucose-1-phosphate thymidylyltransferase RfbA [Candidatus Marinimicrobia bacterium]|nr:glucose-1-phosphate thymidylyltransferase RfbA [Candidatus Neomarinimicrobiota bacterium]MDA9656438.1 glucose-1-phosphate thymidylyltransferase RfbA [Candidatus Neomarinimicrobiota bacterium]MDC0630492.1 glucose-1-phosphate thymidylyltransferase RfbA [Candidatus Neomarinimicrobiota bacterium]